MDAIHYDEKEAFPVNEVGSPWAILTPDRFNALNICLANVHGPRDARELQLTLTESSSFPSSM